MASESEQTNGDVTTIRLSRQLIKGEHREIEEELANRVLSDISEEDAEEIHHAILREHGRTLAGMNSNTNPGTGSGAQGGRIVFVDRDVTPTPLTVDMTPPEGAPEVQSGLHAVQITPSLGDLSPNRANRAGGRSPRPKDVPSAKTSGAGKQPTKVRKKSPSREAIMEVVIATKRGEENELPSPEQAHSISAIDKDRALRKDHEDDEFSRLMADVEATKAEMRARRSQLDELTRNRNLDHLQPESGGRLVEDEDYDWESEYQLGPETYLMSTHNARLSARIRDYRRELWGESAPLAKCGILGWRNRDISVRERRRFSDVVRESSHLQKSMSTMDTQLSSKSSGAIRRVHSDVNIGPQPPVNVFKRDGQYAPVFQTRLKDSTFMPYQTASFTCAVVGSPAPEVTWYHNDNLIVDDARHQCTNENGRISLTINPAVHTDAGAYTCTASNNTGESSNSAQLKLSDGPEPPSRPDVELASDTEVYIIWDPPSTASGMEILAYNLEFRRAGEDCWGCPWMSVSEEVDEEACVVKHLDPQGIYQFRVTARNCSGWGLPSLSSRIIRTHPKGAPKLNVDVLRSECPLMVVTMPQLTTQKAGHALTEIREEDEEEAEAEATASSDTTIVECSEHGPVVLNVSDKLETRYTLREELFRGRHSIVREATDKNTGSRCVVKCILTTGDRRNDSVREYEMLRELRHENIVKLMAAFVRDEFVLLVLERLHETLLQRFVAHDYYTENSVARVSSQVLSAVQWIHFQGVAHLDLRPDNVMFVSKRAWDIKLIDTSRSVQPFSEEAENRALITPFDPEFTAPEILTSLAVAPLADMWNFGVIVFMLLSGFHPFRYDDEDTDELVVRSVTTARVDLDLLFTNASQEALRFVTWALKKQPHRRMSVEEGLQHRWLSCDTAMTRRREMIKYSANRLRKLYLRQQFHRKQTGDQCNPQLITQYGVTPELINN